ncbi:hypothetical protein PG985_016420 [Apiospora marii]|uniref:uncharacterized protein n=1 Tax=Apiospora marii TaxID=335849 RepID=UPI003131D539
MMILVFQQARDLAPLRPKASSDGQGLFYVLYNATTTNPPPALPLPATSPIQKVHSAADRTATWQFGEAFLKVKFMDAQERQCTR